MWLAFPCIFFAIPPFEIRKTLYNHPALPSRRPLRQLHFSLPLLTPLRPDGNPIGDKGNTSSSHGDTAQRRQAIWTDKEKPSAAPAVLQDPFLQTHMFLQTPGADKRPSFRGDIKQIAFLTQSFMCVFISLPLAPWVQHIRASRGKKRNYFQNVTKNRSLRFYQRKHNETWLNRKCWSRKGDTLCLILNKVYGLNKTSPWSALHRTTNT